jgi:hypothetical protein
METPKTVSLIEHRTISLWLSLQILRKIIWKKFNLKFENSLTYDKLYIRKIILYVKYGIIISN